jgi:hypothetical protein
MPRSVKAEQDAVEQPLSSDVLPLEAEVRAADLGSADAGPEAGSEETTEPDASREARIREAAYAAYERRGKAPGGEEEDWLEAERSVDAQRDGRTGSAER